MSTEGMSEAVDLECGNGGAGDSLTDDDIDTSVCFSDAEEGSCYSQFYSTADGDVSYDDEIMEEAVDDSRSVSSLVGSDCSVYVENGVFGKTMVHSEKQEKDCRICHLSLVSSDPEYGIAIELGCSCKDDLAAAHKQCADTWFKIKGNKTCEICNSIAHNVVGPNDIESGQQLHNSNAAAAANNTTTATPEPGESTSDTQRGCFDGRFANFLLACLLFAFVLSWLFHFNVRS